ncbi:MAG: hypothetical protein ABJQ70_12215 [Roseobacter sp.]
MRFIEITLGEEHLCPVLNIGKKFKLFLGNSREALVADERKTYQASAFLLDLNIQALKLNRQVYIVHSHDIYTLVTGLRSA